MNRTCLYSPAAAQSITALWLVLISRPAEGRRLSWPDIFVLWFLLSSIYLLFLAYSQRPQTGCLPYFYTWCGPSANLECSSETCCTRLDGNAGRKKSSKTRHLHTIAEHCRYEPISRRYFHTVNIINRSASADYLRVCHCRRNAELYRGP